VGLVFCWVLFCGACSATPKSILSDENRRYWKDQWLAGASSDIMFVCFTVSERQSRRDKRETPKTDSTVFTSWPIFIFPFSLSHELSIVSIQLGLGWLILAVKWAGWFLWTISSLSGSYNCPLFFFPWYFMWIQPKNLNGQMRSQDMIYIIF
jgi:hypothetical protein